ncbi:MAG: MBOAT family protein [Vicingus serpentipes]|nr:MBOAT family protein [Vicingus serpentipes]
MLFNSISFLIFLPVVFIFYWFFIHKNLNKQNLLILVASYIFYGWWDWRFLSLIFISSLSDYLIGSQIYGASNPKKRKKLLIISIIINLGILGFFKYYNFFVDSFIDLFHLFGVALNKGTLVVLLPVGISFYTFQTLSYTIDIYREKLKPAKDPIAFFAFVAFFPQLVAGPIERAIDLLPQFLKNRKFNYQFAMSGLRMALWGLFKKVVIADNLSKYVDIIYSSPEDYYGLSVIIATIFFTFQVYCDFSGYSDIAIGVARLFGFKLMTNFRTPLFSTSMKEFWSRWHISLSTWFRDYLYIPLGGNRGSKEKWAFNIFITFLISGLWHGASWAFAIWGALNGFYLVYAIYTENIRKKINTFLGVTHFPKILKIFQIISTFCLFAFSLMIFRAESGYDAITLFKHLPQKVGVHFSSLSNFLTPFQELFATPREAFYLTLSFIIFFTGDLIIRNKGIDGVIYKIPKYARIIIYYFVIVWLILFGSFGEPQEFVYFQF